MVSSMVLPLTLCVPLYVPFYGPSMVSLYGSLYCPSLMSPLGPPLWSQLVGSYPGTSVPLDFALAARSHPNDLNDLNDPTP